jgi:Icc-related predicted phosphoesterase
VYSPTRFSESRPVTDSKRQVKKKYYSYFNEGDIARALSFGSADILIVHDWPRGLGLPARIAERDGSVTRGDMIGNEHASRLIAELRPRLVLCGHMHWAHEARIENADGGVTDVHCLAHVLWGGGAVKVFAVDETRCFTLVGTSVRSDA